MDTSDAFLRADSGATYPLVELPVSDGENLPGPEAPSRTVPSPSPRVAGVSIRWKLVFALGGVAIGVLLFAAVAMSRQLATIELAASLEARHMALGIAEASREIGLANTDRLQEYVMRMNQANRRDVVIVDRQKKGLADAHPDERGLPFAGDPGNEVALTLADGTTRTFIEKNDHHPQGARQIVVAVGGAGANAPSAGAVILEYTPIREELLAAARADLALIGIAGALLIVFLGCVAVGLTRQIIGPLRSLELAVRQIYSSDYAVRVDITSDDELGRLGLSFNAMAATLGLEHEALEEHKALLEQRIADRTAELTVANAALQAEVEERQRSAERNEHLAYYDSLTELPNRSLFSKLLKQGLTAAARNGRQLAVLFVDLDRFKNINDTLGHTAGDQLLQEIARRLQGCLRANDTVARLGGDEFVVLLPEIDGPADVENVAQKILGATSKPFATLGQEFHVTASVGISSYPADGEDERTLMKNADIAMYQAKDEGKNNYQFYSAQLNAHTFEKLALESSLRLALERDELELYYQPKIDAATGKVGGMEALLRWEHPELGTVSPAKFIPIAEETGLIVAIGRWVLRTACAQNVKWRELGAAPLCVAVNLSVRQFTDEHLLEDIVTVLRDTGMDPTLLELEITESMLMRDIDKAISVLTAIKKMGIRLAIDDFGTGYSSLSNLKKFPLDTIKVDRSFVRDLPERFEDRSIAEAIIAMGRALSLTVVAEGVETVEQANFLREQSCDEFQGFYFSKPVPAAEFEKLLQAGGASGGWLHDKAKAA